MLNRNPSGNSSNALNSFRKRKQQQGALLRYGAIGLVVLGILFVIVWFTVGSDAPLAQMLATDTPTATATFTPTNTRVPTETSTVTFTPTITSTPTPSAPFPYTVVEGDSLAVIVDKYSLGESGIKLILSLNPFNPETGGGVDPATQIVYPGLVLLLPYPGMPLPTVTPLPANLRPGTEIEYFVELGDTLAGIAAKFNSTEDAIIKANEIENANALLAGQLLRVPINLITATPTLPPTSTPITPTPLVQPTSTALPTSGASVTGTPVASGNCSFTENSSFGAQLRDLINTERKANNLPTLTANPRLAAAARAHAIDLLCHNQFSHEGSDGSTPAERVKAQGYLSTTLFEQLFARYPASASDPATAFNWWMNNPQIRAEILNATVTELGIAYVSSDESLLGGYFVLVIADQ